MKNLFLVLFLLLTISLVACQKKKLPLADIAEPKSKVAYTQEVRLIEPDQTK